MESSIDKAVPENRNYSNSFVGCPEYMSPEMIGGIEGHSFPTDFWSLGAIIYEMIYGLPPFYHENTSTMVWQI